MDKNIKLELVRREIPTGSKIVPLPVLAEITHEYRSQGLKVVLCHGVFDLLHPGHIRHFEEARKLGDILVVTLTEDRYVNKGPGRPAFNEHLRSESIAALSNIDYVAISRFPTAVEVISAIRPHFYVKGQEYEKKEEDVTGGIFDEEKAVHDAGGQIHFTHDITFSSSSLINSRLGVYSENTREFLGKFKTKYSAEDILGWLKKAKDLKVAVIGDAIVDEYHYCEPLGKSPKETIVATRYQGEESFAGGVLACANHIAAFSDNVSLITCLGTRDSKVEFIQSRLNPNIKCQFLYRDDSCTIVKRRYVEPAFLTKMFQIIFMTDTDLPVSTSQESCRHLQETLADCDLVVVADYGHGFLDRDIRNVISEKSPFLALNVQTNSANIGYNLVTKYPLANYICVDEPELRLALQQKYTPIHELITEFAGDYPGATVTITRGHKGSITASPDNASHGLSLVKVPSVSGNVVDRVGAGDAYFAVTSLLAACRAPIEIIGLIGNAAGAMAVGIVCNRSSVEAVALTKFIRSLLA